MYELHRAKLVVRNDPAGSGEFGAPRGDRTHRGIDFVCTPGHYICSPVSGYVSKYGYVYNQDFTHRYIEISTRDGAKHRIFYVLEAIKDMVGKPVRKGSVIGSAQDITLKYPDSGMLPHVHYEIILPDSTERINPYEYHGTSF